MSTINQMIKPKFSTIGASVASKIIDRDRPSVCELVKEAYRSFGTKRAANPNSTFLTFADIEPNSPNRIIALPAAIYGDVKVAGIKWISSFPRNIDINLPRASAVLILNDIETGFPFVCMEASYISAARTAASAIIGADIICGGKRSVHKIGFVGNGPIASKILDFFISAQWSFGEIHLFDIVPKRSHDFRANRLHKCKSPIYIAQSVEELISNVDLLVLTTSASTPYIHDVSLFQHKPRILNISLRDLSPDIILSADNIVDDADHCLRANTSLHLAQRVSNSTDFVSSNIYECLDSKVASAWRPDITRTTIFSPFGMGILDVVVGMYVYQQSAKAESMLIVDDFFP